MALGDERDSFERDGDTSPVEMEAPLGDYTSATRMGINPKSMNDVLYSDIGINILLNRLKQSIASARDFSVFLKKRSSLEDDHAQGLKKLSRSTFDAARRHDARQGSYALQLADISRAHERMADHGIQFALSLNQMHEDLNELSNSMERGRKHWKSEGSNSEKKVKDAESAMEKAKARYDSLAEDYDRARTGDKTSGRVFTVKGPKSAERHEEDLLRKLQAADSDYASKVQGAQSQRQENIMTSRPQAVKAVQELIKECDSALTLQLQKFAAFNEKLLVGNGMIVSPVKDASSDNVGESLSMREMVQQIDNERDFQTYVTSHTNNVPPKAADIQYEKHPTLAAHPQAPPMKQNTLSADRIVVDRQPETPAAAYHQPKSSMADVSPAAAQASSATTTPSSSLGYQGRQQAMRDRSFRGPPSNTPSAQSSSLAIAAAAAAAESERNYRSSPSQAYQSQAQPTPTAISNGQVGGPYAMKQPQAQQPYQGSNGPAMQPKIPTQYQSNNAPNSQYQSHNPATSQYQAGPQPPALYHSNNPSTSQYQSNNGQNGSYPSRDQPPQVPSKPVFGINLEQLFRRDESAVPLVVLQCIQAVDLFGLDVEGIYRLSGNAAHIQQLKGLFDQDSSRIDFRNPENFHHDVNSVAGLLKQFLRDLPEPLMTVEFYDDFIEAARVDDDIQRRDSLHAVINSLPDPNYATLRALVLHLNRVQEHSQTNRMSSSNLAICFAPTVMGPHRGPNMADAGLQARVVDTILQNTYQIFDED